ncbi:MAG: lysophospholipid acyltransferase family protein [Novosphingobium sp.]|nr:lysophospholipid acyltransferase family protein [Novosphingobium sp.]
MTATSARTRPASRIGPPGWLLVSVRLVLMLALLLVCLPLYYLWRLLRRHRFWPRVFLAGIGWIAGLRVAVRGTPHKRALFLANHLTWLDIPAIAAASGSAFVAHDGLAQIAVMKHLCAMNDTVFVARHRRAGVAAQAEEVRHALDDTGALTLFPEGTTGDGRELLPFKSALLAAVEPLPEGVAVQPVLLDYGAEAPAIAWHGKESGIANFLRILARRRPLRLTAHFLPPLAGEALENRKNMAAAARAAIAGRKGIA